ncbi:sugar 3,4-ketoisomerase [Shivajiella indica]|uniref:Sugar 3,4-ketoisomerase n=1 Tax=Shivajiella indica TaxID=872115 RepID=A0ABW5BE96_9BACT
MTTRLKDCFLIPFYQQNSENGDLVSAHSFQEIPFEVQRVYYLYDVTAERKSGQHANIQNQQVMVAVKGSFKVRLYDGQETRTFNLDQPNEGLLVREGIWREVFDFSEDAICLVLCSEKFEEGDYLKDWEVFMDWKLKNIYPA